jgi:hypothetical protein
MTFLSKAQYILRILPLDVWQLVVGSRYKCLALMNEKYLPFPLPQCCILLIRMASVFCNRSTLDQKLTFRTLMRIFRKPVTMHNFVPCGYLESSQFDHSMSESELKYFTTEFSQNFPLHDPRTKGMPRRWAFKSPLKTVVGRIV